MDAYEDCVTISFCNTHFFIIRKNVAYQKSLKLYPVSFLDSCLYSSVRLIYHRGWYKRLSVYKAS